MARSPAIAGRSIPGSDLMTIFASASSAPVLPAETRPDASPRATASIARRMDDCRLRSAAVGFMSLPMTSGAWRTVQAARARLCRASNAVSTGFVANQQEARRGMTFRGEFQPLHHHVRGVVAPHGIHREGERTGHGRDPATGARRDPPQTRTAPRSGFPAATTSRPS